MYYLSPFLSQESGKSGCEGASLLHNLPFVLYLNEEKNEYKMFKEIPVLKLRFCWNAKSSPPTLLLVD